MEEFVYVIWGRIEPADNVWGNDGQTYFKECPVLVIFKDYDAAKKEFLLYIEDAFHALKDYIGEDAEKLEDEMAGLMDNYTPNDETQNGYQLIVSKNKDLDLNKEYDIISWAWYAFNWDEHIHPSPILPCVYLEKMKVHKND